MHLNGPLLLSCRNEEGEEQLGLRQLQLPFNFATGEAQLYDTSLSLDVPDLCSASKIRKTDDEPSDTSSLLGCLLSQDRSIYCKHEKPNNISSISDVAFQDSHATVSIPRELKPKPAVVGPLLKMDPTVQDMVDTLEQIFGDSELIDVVDVGPEELKSWETSLMNFNANNEVFKDDLCDLLNSDILSYVAEQLQNEGGLPLSDHLDQLTATIPPVPLQNPDPIGQKNFSWHLPSQNQPTPNGAPPPPLSGTMKLSHLDLPQMPGLNGLQPQVPVPSSLQLGSSVTFNPSCFQAQTQQRVFKSSPTDLPTVPGLPDQNQNPAGPLNPVFIFKGNQWNDSNPDQNFVEPYAPNISNTPGLPVDPPSSCYTQNQISGFQSSPTIQNPFRTPETVPFPDQLDRMFRNPAPAPLPNGVHPSRARSNIDSFQVPTENPCYYQALPGGGAVAALPTPEEAPRSYHLAAGLRSNGLTMQQHFLRFSENTQVDTTIPFL